MPNSSARPVLTIAIPTYNRAETLRKSLDVLVPQVLADPGVELLISDNASPDHTAAVCADFAASTAPGRERIVVFRHPENVGADANFASCYHRASGQYVWVCGDDDIIVPGALESIMQHLRDGSVDILYATSYGFHRDFMAERQTDPLGRSFHTIRDPRVFAMVVNVMFTFISGIVVNKDRLEAMPHEPPEAFLATNLVQLSWTVPLLRNFRKGVVVWTRPLAAQAGAAAGYSVGHVFGQNLNATLRRILDGRPDLYNPILNFALRRWFPSAMLDVRVQNMSSLRIEEAEGVMRKAYGRNPRYWIFTYPALVLPLPLARLYEKISAAVGKFIYMLTVPGFWKKESR